MQCAKPRRRPPRVHGESEALGRICKGPPRTCSRAQKYRWDCLPSGLSTGDLLLSTAKKKYFYCFKIYHIILLMLKLESRKTSCTTKIISLESRLSKTPTRHHFHSHFKCKPLFNPRVMTRAAGETPALYFACS